MTSMNEITRDTLYATEQRRAVERQVTVLINAGIAQHGRDGLCRIRNISPSGMNIETGIALETGKAVTIELRSGRRLEGEVRWVKEHLSGLHFPEENVGEVLNDRVSGDVVARVGAHPRFTRSGFAICKINHRRQNCTIISISLADVTLGGLHDLKPDTVLTVEISGLGEQLAKVVRQDEDETRVMFVQPLNYRALEAWLVDPSHRTANQVAAPDFDI